MIMTEFRQRSAAALIALILIATGGIAVADTTKAKKPSKSELATEENARLTEDTVACIALRYDRGEAALKKPDDPFLNPSLPFRIMDAGTGGEGLHLNCPGNVCGKGTLEPDETHRHCATVGVSDGKVLFDLAIGDRSVPPGVECLIYKVGDGDMVQVFVEPMEDAPDRLHVDCLRVPAEAEKPQTN